MANLRQQAQDLAQQLTAAIAEARYRQEQTAQQVVADDRRTRDAAAAGRQAALAEANRQRQSVLDAAN